MFVSFKKFVSIFMSALCIATAFVGQASAARSANSSDAHIVAEVEKFNQEKLHKLQKYIEQLGPKDPITSDLKVLYNKLDCLVVSNTKLALELNEPYDSDLPSPTIGYQLGRMFGFLEIMSREYTQDTFTAQMRCASIVKYILGRVDQLNN